MTPDQIAAVEVSFAGLGERRALLAERFFALLFERSPEVVPLFTIDASLQRERFIDELGELVVSIVDLPAFRTRTAALGERHARYGVRVGHYSVVGDALIEALREVLGDELDARTEEAWRLAYNLVAECMLAGAAHARTR